MGGEVSLPLVGAAAVLAVLVVLALQVLVAWVKGLAFRLALHHLAYAAIGGIGLAAFEGHLPGALSGLLDGVRWLASLVGVPV